MGDYGLWHKAQETLEYKENTWRLIFIYNSGPLQKGQKNYGPKSIRKSEGSQNPPINPKPSTATSPIYTSFKRLFFIRLFLSTLSNTRSFILPIASEQQWNFGVIFALFYASYVCIWLQMEIFGVLQSICCSNYCKPRFNFWFLLCKYIQIEVYCYC